METVQIKVSGGFKDSPGFVDGFKFNHTFSVPKSYIELNDDISKEASLNSITEDFLRKQYPNKMSQGLLTGMPSITTFGLNNS